MRSAQLGAPFVYHLLHILLRREAVVNDRKNKRFYREGCLAVRRSCSRTCTVGTKAPAPTLAMPNQRWSLSFAYGQIVTGRRLRVPKVNVNIICESACYFDIGESFRAQTDKAERPAGQTRNDRRRQWRRAQQHAVLAWCSQMGMKWYYFAPGKIMQNVYLAGFYRRCVKSY
jgi:putative transposase